MSKTNKSQTDDGNEPAVVLSLDDKSKSGVTAEWQKLLYTPERLQLLADGKITQQEFHAHTGPEMLAIALMGFQMYEQGKLKDAKTIFMGLCTLDPQESYYRTAIGAVFLAEDNLESALECFNQAIGLNPKEIASFVNRGEVHLRLGKILEAAQDFKSAVDLDPKGADPLSHRARILAAAAVEMIEEAQKKTETPPKNAEAPKKK